MSAEVFIKRPVLSSVLSIIIVIAGLVSMGALPITQYPEITPVQVTVSASYPGADAETVANSVAAPMETKINGVDNMLYMQSSSSPTGQMTLTVFFDIDTDPDTAEVQVNNRVQQALPELPDTVRNAGVTVEKRSSSFLMLIGLYSPDERFDEKYLGNYANLYVLDAIKRTEGANQASIMGLPDLAMRLWLQPDRMASLGITASDIQQSVSQQNQQFGVGSLGQSPTTRPVEMSFPVVTRGRFSEPDEFENIILRADSKGTAIVRVKDVASAEEGLKAYMLRSTLNGKEATFIAVYQQPGSNAVQVSQNVRKLMEELKKSFPDGLDYTISLDTTKFVQASIDEVTDTLIIAIILVVLVTYIFLQNINATLIPTIAILVSVIGTFMGMIALGFSINLLTLFGLVLAIGIVCDDAIVVVENVERNMHEHKMSGLDATLQAMKEVTGPVIATTLVLIAVFVPVAFLGGTTGVLYKQFAITIAISVAISSFAALTLTPALSAILLRPQKKEPAGFFRLFNTLIEKLTVVYALGVSLLMRHAVIAMLMIAAMLFGLVTLFKIIPGSFVPEEDQGYMFAAVMLPDGASLDRSQELTQKVADIFSRHPAVQDATVLAGYSLIDGQFKTNSGTVFVAFKDFNERTTPELSAEAVMQYVHPRLAALKEGIIIPINPPSIPGLGTQGGFEYWLQNKGLGGVPRLAKITNELVAKGNKTESLTALNSTLNASSRQLMTKVDRAKAETLGVPVQDVFASLQTLFGSLYVSQYNKYGRVWQVILQANPEYREKPEDIANIFVRQRHGEMVPLSALVETYYTQGPDLVSRFNGFIAAKITGDAAPGYSSGDSIAAMQKLSTELPEGFSYAWAGQAYEEVKAGSTSTIIFIFALVMVFLILSAQYEQWSLPMAVITAVPFGIFGALLTVWLRGMENDVYFQIGLVTLIGLSAKNAILIVEFAEQKYQEGFAPFDAALEAAKLRLRPILMTSLSFILGSMPLVLASGAGANARHSIGTGIIGGMVAATSLALFFVPLFYYLITSSKEKMSGKRRLTTASADNKETPSS
ncbi:MAG: multidrug efflux RND transporter permease subunit [gamma proteobacterium symbiont of Bathyaustriella thionipta]|nr:multidrug efflux RND transporter permease subunit [gamma proteobacterium symbiont of Bathyaustriella thionipta]